jgi:hypothetical protein
MIKVVIVEYKNKPNSKRRITIGKEFKLGGEPSVPSRMPRQYSLREKPIRNDSMFDCKGYTCKKSWKKQKHACKCWMRHLHRLSPSPRALILTGRCIYPNVG